jgi:NAD(P)H dehydrogenase (quinone)
MHHLIILAHPNPESFCSRGISRTLTEALSQRGVSYTLVDLYAEGFNVLGDPEKARHYQELISQCTHIWFVSPVWWFRCTPLMEGFFDQVFVPGFAYRFKQLIGVYGIPQPLLGDKKVMTYLTHGAPALPVLTLYVNSVKLRLVMGVYSFVFGWFRTRTRQFWSVPFVSDAKRAKYLKQVVKDVERSL